MDGILWHRRESRRKTEKTNTVLQLRESPVYSKWLSPLACRPSGFLSSNQLWDLGLYPP